MNRMITCILVMLFSVVGCGEPDDVGCSEYGDEVYCSKYDTWVSKKAFDEDHDLIDTSKERAVPKDQIQFDYEMYKSWDRMTKIVFDYREMAWEATDGELDPKCYDKLPNVKFIEDGCWDGVVACHYWGDKENRWQIRVLTKHRDTCKKQVHSLYHEFTHNLLVCSYGDKSHNDEYFDTDEYWGAIDKLQQEICY